MPVPSLIMNGTKLAKQTFNPKTVHLASVNCKKAESCELRPTKKLATRLSLHLLPLPRTATIRGPVYFYGILSNIMIKT